MIVRGFFSREAVECSSRARSCYLGVEAGWETYIVWLVNVMNHDTNLAAWDVSNRITEEEEEEEEEGEGNKILRTSNCMTEVERQEVSNRRNVTGNVQDR
jgi:hypothetical protein